MSLKVECAWARTCIRETKPLCSLTKASEEGKAKFGARVLHERYKLYCKQFNGYSNFNITQYEFNRVSKKIDEQVANWRCKEDKQLYLSRFSMGNWSGGNTMTSETRKAHSLSNCKACQLHNSQYQTTYPMKKMCMSAKMGPLSNITMDANKQTMHTAGIKATKKQLKSVGQTIYSTYNDKCKENFGKTLSEILVLVPEAGLEIKLSPTEKRKEKRSKLRQTKRDIEDRVMKENDTDVHLNSRESYSARQSRRLAQSFETTEQAKERASKTSPKMKERSHIPALENITGDIDQLMADIDSWPHGHVNWSEKARRYNIKYKGQDSTPPNGGQILKSLLQATEGVNMANFDAAENQDGPIEFRVRRALKKQEGGEISIPVPRTNEQIRASIKKLIDDGTYDVGVPVVQTEIAKLALSNEGEVIQKNTIVSGRKIPLKQIRAEALVRNKDLLRIKDDNFYEKLTREEIIQELNKINEATGDNTEEMRDRLKKFQRQRHWFIWHDHSTLANYGHMLFCLRELYDPSIHLTRQEALQKTKKDVDVQASIEEPQLYILGQSASTIDDQMKFVPTRQEDLKEMCEPIMTDDGKIVHDIMRFMNGDNPASEMEDGTQHGGNYACPGCDTNINSSYDLEYSLQRKYKNIETKQKMILTGPAGKKGGFHPFKNLKVKDIKAELRARNRPTEGKKEELEVELAEILGGTTRLPALLYPNKDFDVSVKSLNLESYEVLYFEAMHCSMNHIKNVLHELPHHITDIDTLIKLKEILSIQYSKEKLRAVDYRKTLIYVTTALYPLANREIKLLLTTLCEMIEIFYNQDEKRTPKMVLRLHNLCWRHAIQCKRVLTPIKSLTYRKLFGLYFHSCTNHSAQLLRLISHRSTNAEMLERLFEKLSSITSKTWSRRIEDLSKNAILHYQVEKKQPNKCLLKEERAISKLAKALPKLENSVILVTDIEKYAGDWCAHLQLIADFLEPGEGIWWRQQDGCVEFLDGPNEEHFQQEGPPLHHFRSSSITKEQQQLSATWRKCLEEEIKLPTTKVRNHNGKWHRPPYCLADYTEGRDVNLAVLDNEDNRDVDMIDDEERRDAVMELDDEIDCGDEEVRIEPSADTVLNHDIEDIGTERNNDYQTVEIREDMSLVDKHNTTRKRSISKDDHTNEEPPTKKSKSIDDSNNKTQETLSKTATALQLVIGNCEDVLKFEKLKENVQKNPKSTFHIERYELHLIKVQITTLKIYKQVSNDIKRWKEDFCKSMQREATDNDLMENSLMTSKRKQSKTALSLLKLWKLHEFT